MRARSRWFMSAVGLAALAVPVVSGGPAGASTQGPNHASVDILGKDHFVPNRLTNNFRFSPFTTVIRHGGTITFHNGTGDGHTMALVTKDARPKNTSQVDNCGAPGTVCFGVNNAFGFPPQGGPPQAFQIDNGKRNDDDAQGDADAVDVGAGVGPAALIEDFDTPSSNNTVGDASVIGPRGGPASNRTIVVTAAPGLYHYICTIHAWMQGEIQVVR